jgi:hypothetical protein
MFLVGHRAGGSAAPTGGPSSEGEAEGGLSLRAWGLSALIVFLPELRIVICQKYVEEDVCFSCTMRKWPWHFVSML